MFDEDGNCQMDFCEYMLAVQSTKLETPEDKLKWVFRMYDKNFSGSIDTDELATMFSTLFEMTRVKISETQMDMLVTDVMQVKRITFVMRRVFCNALLCLFRRLTRTVTARSTLTSSSVAA